MGLETHAIVEIKERFHKEDKALPYMFWEHGTLWIDTNDTSDIDTIKDVMENEVLNNGFKTKQLLPKWITHITQKWIQKCF